MRRSVLLTLSVVALLGGCAGGASPGPAPGGNGPQTYDEPGALPGVENGSVVDAAALVNATASAVNGTDYVAEGRIAYRFNTTRPDRSRNRTVRVDAEGGWTVEQVATYDFDNGTTVPYATDRVWSNGTVAVYRRWSREDGEQFTPADLTQSDRDSVARLESALAAGDFEFERTVERGSERRYVFVADGYAPDARKADDPLAESFRGRVVVDEHGRIRNGTVSYASLYTTAEDEPARVRFEISFTLRPGAEVDVEPPGWLGEARAAGAVVPCEDDVDDYECN